MMLEIILTQKLILILFISIAGNALPSKRVAPEKETKKLSNLEQTNCNLTCNSLKNITEPVNESLHMNLNQNIQVS